MPDNNSINIDFSKVKLFQPGTFNSKTTSADDLKSSVEFYKDHPNCFADLKITHEATKANRDAKYKVFESFPFSVGKVINQEYSDITQALYADYVNVFEPTKKALTDGLLTTHSCENYYNVNSKINGKDYPCVITAVALLTAGEMPALFEIFEPYMYELQDTATSETNNIFDSNNFTFESKQIHVFKNFNNEESRKMEDENLETVNAADNVSTDLQEVIRQNKEKDEKLEKLEKMIFALSTEKGQAKDKRIEYLENTVSALISKDKAEKVELFLNSLIKSDRPKLEESSRDKAKAFLMSLDNQEKVSFSVAGATVEKTSFEFAQEFLNTLPEIKQIYSTKTLSQSDDGIVITNADKLSMPDLSLDEIFEQKRAEKAVYAKAKELNIDIDASFENYQKVANMVMFNQ